MASAGLSRYKLKEKGSAEFKNKTLRGLYKSMHREQHPYLGIMRISVKPPRKLCDITGLPAPYTCPRTSLRFFNLSVYKYLRSLSSEQHDMFYQIKTYGSTLQSLMK